MAGAGEDLGEGDARGCLRAGRVGCGELVGQGLEVADGGGRITGLGEREGGANAGLGIGGTRRIGGDLSPGFKNGEDLPEERDGTLLLQLLRNRQSAPGVGDGLVPAAGEGEGLGEEAAGRSLEGRDAGGSGAIHQRGEEVDRAG